MMSAPKFTDRRSNPRPKPRAANREAARQLFKKLGWTSTGPKEDFTRAYCPVCLRQGQRYSLNWSYAPLAIRHLAEVHEITVRLVGDHVIMSGPPPKSSRVDPLDAELLEKAKNSLARHGRRVGSLERKLENLRETHPAVRRYLAMQEIHRRELKKAERAERDIIHYVMKKESNA